jgi:hypothetical protein
MEHFQQVQRTFAATAFRLSGLSAGDESCQFLSRIKAWA